MDDWDIIWGMQQPYEKGPQYGRPALTDPEPSISEILQVDTRPSLWDWLFWWWK